MKLLVVAGLALLAGCGRRGFDPQDGGAGGDAADGAVSTCGVTFCDDFEDGDTFPWNTQTSNGGSGVEQGGQFVVTVPATTASSFLAMNLPAPTTSVTISMKIGYATTNAGTNCELDLVSLYWDSGTCVTPVWLRVRA